MSASQPEDADTTARAQRRQRMRRVQVAMAILNACIGLFSFSGVAGNARFEAYHTLDVIRLMTAGAGFGIALVLLVQVFAFPGPRSEPKSEKGQGTP